MNPGHTIHRSLAAVLIFMFLALALAPSAQAFEVEGNYTLGSKSGLLTLGKTSFSGTLNGTYVAHNTTSTIDGASELYLLPASGLEFNASKINLTDPNSSLPGLEHYTGITSLQINANILLWNNLTGTFSGNYPILATGFARISNHSIFLSYMPGNLSLQSTGMVNSTLLLKDYSVVVNGTEVAHGDYAALLLSGAGIESTHNSLFNFLTVEGTIKLQVSDAGDEEFNRFVDTFQSNIEDFMRNKASAANESSPFLPGMSGLPPTRGNATSGNASTPFDESPLNIDLASNLRDIAPIANGLVLVINADGAITAEGQVKKMNTFAFLRSEHMNVQIDAGTGQTTVITSGNVKFAFVDTAFLGPEFRSFYIFVLLLWSGAVLTYVFFPDKGRGKKEKDKDEDYAGYASLARWGVLAVSFLLWDNAVGNMFGFSLIPILRDALTGSGPVEEGLSNHLIAIGLLSLIELGPWTFLTFAVGLPFSFIGKTIGTRMGYKKVGKYFGKSLKHFSVYVFGVSYLTLVLNIAIGRLLSSGFMPQF